MRTGFEAPESNAAFLSDGGELGALLRAHDWSTAPLGRPDSWPQSLKTLVGVMLAAVQPMFVVWDPRRALLYNAAYAEILGRRHPALAQDFLEVWHEIKPDLLPVVERAYLGEASHGNDIRLVTERHGCAEETRFAFSCTPVRDEEGSIAGLFSVVQAVSTIERAPSRSASATIGDTGIRRTEDGWRDSDSRYRQIVEGAEDFAIVMLDARGTIQTWNSGAERMTGRAADAAIGRPGATFFTPEDREAGLLDRDMKLAQAARRAVNERWYVRKDGSRFWGSGFLTSLADEGGGYVMILRDRTAEHLAEAAVRESEARFRMLADAVPQIIWITDAQGDLEFFNKQWTNYLGVPELPSNAGKVAAGYVHPDDEAMTMAAFVQAVQTSGVFEVEHRIRRKDGVYRWFLVRAEPYRDPRTGEIVRWFGTSVDIHDRKTAEAALRESEARYRTLFDSIDEGFCVVQFIDGTRGPLTDYVHLEANPAYIRHAGIAHIVGKTGRDELTESEADAWVAIFRGVLDTGRPVRFERELEATDRHLDVACFRIEPADKRQVAIIFKDISARKQAERSLQELNETLESQVTERTAERDRLWSLSQDMLARANYAGTMSAVSPAWTQVLGWSEAELLTRPYASFMHPDDMPGTLQAIVGMAETHRPARFENRIATRDGNWKHIEWTVTPEPDGVNFVAIGRDLSLNKAREAELQQAQDALRQSQKMEAVGQLTGGLAHDFNNLLASISGGLQVLKLKLQLGQHSGLERYIDIGESSVRRAASLTQRLLAFSRRQTLDPKPTDVNRLINGMEELVRRSVGPMVELEVVNAVDLWATRVDPSQLENALLNLCINGRDAMMPGGGKLSLVTANEVIDERTAKDGGMRPGQYISLRVADTGTGMPPEVVARVFDPFYTTKPLGEGTGLGLSMVYGFVRQSEGQVRVQSEVGVGTTMCLYLPRYAGAAQAEEVSVDRSIESGHGETVLLIEDECALRDIVEEVLCNAGYRVLTAQDGPAGLHVLNSDTRVDLLVTDVGLPNGLNGRQVADAARVRRPSLKVLFITGYADTAAVGDGRLDPGMEVMTKPFEISEFANKVRALIDTRVLH